MSNKKMKKEMEQKMYIKKSLRRMKKNAESVENSRQILIRKALDAKERGLTDLYVLCTSKLKLVVQQGLKAENMVLQLELAQQMKDTEQMYSSFVGAMGIISNDISKTSKVIKFDKMRLQFDEAMMNFENDTMNLDDFMEDSTDTFEDMSSDTSSITDEEIERMISGNVSDTSKSIDKDIDKKLDEVNSILKETN